MSNRKENNNFIHMKDKGKIAAFARKLSPPIALWISTSHFRGITTSLVISHLIQFLFISSPISSLPEYAYIWVFSSNTRIP